MKILLLLGLVTSTVSLSFSQDQDTLRNLSLEVPLTTHEYNGANRWGYATGHNYLGRQEYAEKYYIAGSAKVTGIISHHQGVVTNKKNVGEFALYSVNEKGLPGNVLNSTQWYFEDLDLSGNAHFTPLNGAVIVADSFFVSFNLTDYSHGGFEGDTLVLMTGPEGSRSEEDLSVWGRNVARFHNHSKPDYRDFYHQNGTPIATHFALYPIVEFNYNPITGIEGQFIAKNQLKLYPSYPNPVVDRFNLKYSLNKTSYVVVQISDIQGRVMFSKELGLQSVGEHTERVNIGSFADGTYIYSVQTGAVKLASRLVVN